MPRLLILSTTFYPDPGVGAVRMTQWAKWLPEYGWETHVLCRHYGYDANADQLARDVHPGVALHYLGAKTPRFVTQGSPSALAGWRRRLKEGVDKWIVPDGSLVTWKRLAAQAVELTREIKPDVVLSSGPQHSIHWLAKRMARATDAKWAADFRDPYTIDVRFQPSGWRAPLRMAHKRFERSIYHEADLTIHAIPLHGRWASRAYPGHKGPAMVLPNGAPTELIEFAKSPRPQARAERLSLRSVGHLSPAAPAMLFEALEALAVEGVDVEFRHAGHAPVTVGELPAKAFERMTFLGPVPHPEALRLVAGADLLVAFLSAYRSTYLGVSSKLFEFLATGNPVLAVNPTRTDRQLLRRQAGCEVLNHPDAAAIAKALKKMAVTARSRTPQGPDAAFVNRYDRRRQVELLAGWLDRLIS